MNIFEAIMQGIIQGLTEFLPVSSSGHLSLYQHFTGNSGEGALLFSAVLHLGTLVAVFTAFRKTIWELIKELGFMIKDIFTGKFKWKEMNPPRRAIIMMIISHLMLILFTYSRTFSRECPKTVILLLRVSAFCILQLFYFFPTDVLREIKNSMIYG